MGFIGFLTKNKRRFESRRYGFTPFAPLDSKRTENEYIRNICSYSDNVPATYRPDGKSAKKAPSSRAWSLPPAVREAGKRNAEGLAAKLTEGVRRARDARPYNVVGKK